MPRIITRKVEVDDVPRFCPACGAANTTAGLRCTICGNQFTTPDAVASLWGNNAQNQRSSADQEFTDLYSDPTPEPVVTAAEPISDTMSTRPFTPVHDPWSSTGGGRLGADPKSEKAFLPPIDTGRKPKAGGPPGWLLGIVGIVLILAVVGVAAFFIGQPLVSDEIADKTSEGIEQAVAEVTIPASIPAGTITVTEQDVNRTIRENAEAFEPVRDIRVQIRRTGIEADLRVFGVTTTLTGTLDVEDGRVIVVNPQLSGVANRLVNIDDITPRVEDAVNDVLARNNVVPTEIVLADDTLTITTIPAAP